VLYSVITLGSEHFYIFVETVTRSYFWRTQKTLKIAIGSGNSKRDLPLPKRLKITALEQWQATLLYLRVII